MMTELGLWWTRLADALQHPTFHAAFLALLVGIALAEWLAHMLPSRLQAQIAERIVRVCVLLLVTGGAYKLHPTTIGAGWALFAGLASVSIHHHLQSWAYAKWPSLQPKALRT